MKILVAEDDYDIALTYEKALERKNYQTTITSNGEDCLKVYNDEMQKRTLNTISNHTYYSSLSNDPPFDIHTIFFAEYGIGFKIIVIK
jgi:CheY-like chemotaxis protein